MYKQSYDPACHNRQSLRLPTYDYSSNGAYFVTICLQERQPLLEISELHTILEDTWNTLPQRFPTITLDDFIIMPDHMHFIVWLNPVKGGHLTLGEVVGTYKSLTGRVALKHLRTQGYPCGNQFWQRSYYDHVIRSEFELQQNAPISVTIQSRKTLSRIGYESVIVAP